MTNDTFASRMSRRAFLSFSTRCAAGAMVGLPLTAFAAPTASHHRLSFYHTHTGETLTINLKNAGTGTLRKVNRFLRDFRTGEVCTMDPKLLAILSRIKKISGSRGRYEVISGFRSPATNEKLNRTTNGVASKSLHMEGRAIDVRLTDLKTSTLREIACALKGGGVGYYPKSNFVHLDTGRIRYW